MAEVGKVKLTFGRFDYNHYVSVFDDVEVIQDIMWAYGYEITLRDTYKAWMAGNDGVWETLDGTYSDKCIVEEVLAFCMAESVQGEGESGLPMSIWKEMSEEAANQLNEEVEDYEPKLNAKVEGAPWFASSGSNRFEASGNATVH